MATQNINEFLGAYGEEYLVERGVLEHSSGPIRGERYLLTGKTLSGVISFMREKGIDRLVEGKWWLDQNGHFNNANAPMGQRDGHYSRLERPGFVFDYQNININPHFPRK